MKCGHIGAEGLLHVFSIGFRFIVRGTLQVTGQSWLIVSRISRSPVVTKFEHIDLRTCTVAECRKHLVPTIDLDDLTI